MNKDLNKFEKKIKFKFKNTDLLQQVFVHRSYINEHPGFRLSHNERLEFLGDAVLELIVTEYLYKHYDNPEGELTNWRSSLVKGEMLSELAKKICIDDYLYLSRGEQKSTGKARQLILANAFEALIGAIYLDQGYEITKKFVERVLLIKLPNIIKNKLYIDSKSLLQELIQEKIGYTPNYQLLEESGPDHDKKFEVGVYVNNQLYGTGIGSSKNEAQQDAAHNALVNNNYI